MNKDYQKPDFEYISLIVEDEITKLDGELGMSDSIFG